MVPPQTSNLNSKKVSVYINNIKRITNTALVRVQVELKDDAKILDPSVNMSSNIKVVSTMSQTMVSFNSPEFSIGGIATVWVWVGVGVWVGVVL